MGIAFFMLRSYFVSDIQQKLYAARTTVMADYLFTLPAAIIQPLSGIALIIMAGYDWASTWLVVTFAIYLVAAACWLPVVWIQIQLKRMCEASYEQGIELPASYGRLFRVWFYLGWPAFLGLVAVFYLMVAKPQ